MKTKKECDEDIEIDPSDVDTEKNPKIRIGLGTLIWTRLLFGKFHK